ncbi:MAG: hypothetical protein M3081_10265 [Gemmatimonadota bacterium]|nr:hypothetical protein [Gemmatimonadota bacterium]
MITSARAAPKLDVSPFGGLVMYREIESELGAILLHGQSAEVTAALRNYLAGIDSGLGEGAYSPLAIRLRQATRVFAYLAREAGTPAEEMLIALDHAVTRAHDSSAWFLRDEPEDYLIAYDAAADWTVRWALREFRRDD